MGPKKAWTRHDCRLGSHGGNGIHISWLEHLCSGEKIGEEVSALVAAWELAWRLVREQEQEMESMAVLEQLVEAEAWKLE